MKSIKFEKNSDRGFVVALEDSQGNVEYREPSIDLLSSAAELQDVLDYQADLLELAENSIADLVDEFDIIKFRDYYSQYSQLLTKLNQLEPLIAALQPIEEKDKK